MPRRLIAVTSVEALGRLLGEVAGEADDTGVVERHVQPTIGSDGVLDHGGGLRLVRHVAGDADRLAAGGGQPSGRGVEGVGVDVGEHDSGARLGERLRGGQPDARAGAGDQGDLTGEVIDRVHSHPLAYSYLSLS